MADRYARLFRWVSLVDELAVARRMQEVIRAAHLLRHAMIRDIRRCARGPGARRSPSIYFQRRKSTLFSLLILLRRYGAPAPPSFGRCIERIFDAADARYFMPTREPKYGFAASGERHYAYRSPRSADSHERGLKRFYLQRISYYGQAE